MCDRANRDVGDARKPIGEQAQGDALAGTGIAVDHREAAFSDLGVLDAPAEVLHARRHVDRLGG